MKTADARSRCSTARSGKRYEFRKNRHLPLIDADLDSVKIESSLSDFSSLFAFRFSITTQRLFLHSALVIR